MATATMQAKLHRKSHSKNKLEKKCIIEPYIKVVVPAIDASFDEFRKKEERPLTFDNYCDFLANFFVSEENTNRDEEIQIVRNAINEQYGTITSYITKTYGPGKDLSLPLGLLAFLFFDIPPHLNKESIKDMTDKQIMYDMLHCDMLKFHFDRILV